ncbi:hypothetical protein NC652_005690 [Populus alba x Populus x berolinensis]|nr:hypothetical protein NC652_005690 [Populus alba x Populus x berolinensis]
MRSPRNVDIKLWDLMDEDELPSTGPWFGTCCSSISTLSGSGDNINRSCLCKQLVDASVDMDNGQSMISLLEMRRISFLLDHTTTLGYRHHRNHSQISPLQSHSNRYARTGT